MYMYSGRQLVYNLIGTVLMMSSVRRHLDPHRDEDCYESTKGSSSDATRDGP